MKTKISSLLVCLLLASFGSAQNYARMLSGVNSQTGTSYLFVPADSTRLTTFANASAIAVSLPSGITTGFGVGNEFDAQNLGPGTATITCSSCTIYSANSTGSATLALSAGQGVELFSAGTNYFALTGGGIVVGGAQGQLGDTLRFNVNGDNAWDAVNSAAPLSWLYAVWGGVPAAGAGGGTGGPVGASGYGDAGSHTSINPTYNVGTGDQYSASASPSTSTVIGEYLGENGSNSFVGITAFYRWSAKWQIGNTTNVRYWIGFGSYTNTGTAPNNAQLAGTTRYAADTGVGTTIGFRFSAGTDTHWQAVTCVAGGSQTTVDTGITPDTNIHLFEMATDPTSQIIYFFIDNVKVATISTNIPNPSATANSWGSFFWTGDNKNTATAISATRYWWVMSHK
jgi:hypothetical protein